MEGRYNLLNFIVLYRFLNVRLKNIFLYLPHSTRKRKEE